MQEKGLLKKIYLIGFWPDYEEFFFEDLNIEGFCAETFNPSYTQNAENLLFKYAPRSIKNRIYIKRVKRLMSANPDATYIFQDSRIFLNFLTEVTTNSANCCVMFRNVVKPSQRMMRYLMQLKVKGVLLWSFDFNDCERYGLNYYPQFIKKYEDIHSIKPQYDFSFVGRDKNRSQWLYEFKERVEAKGLKVYLDIRGDKKEDSLTYREYLEGMCQGRCFLDLVQDNQSGLTLRPLEALVYGRKIMTNNKNVPEEMAFNQDNIKYFDNENYEVGLKIFMEKPYEYQSLAQVSDAEKAVSMMIEGA